MSFEGIIAITVATAAAVGTTQQRSRQRHHSVGDRTPADGGGGYDRSTGCNGLAKVLTIDGEEALNHCINYPINYRVNYRINRASLQQPFLFQNFFKPNIIRCMYA